jgi:hypothetical protein
MMEGVEESNRQITPKAGLAARLEKKSGQESKITALGCERQLHIKEN